MMVKKSGFDLNGKSLTRKFISQSDAIQRAGRVGRTGVGIVFQIIPEAVYEKLPYRFTNSFGDEPDKMLYSIWTSFRSGDDNREVRTKNLALKMGLDESKFNQFINTGIKYGYISKISNHNSLVKSKEVILALICDLPLSFLASRIIAEGYYEEIAISRGNIEYDGEKKNDYFLPIDENLYVSEDNKSDANKARKYYPNNISWYMFIGCMLENHRFIIKEEKTIPSKYIGRDFLEKSLNVWKYLLTKFRSIDVTHYQFDSSEIARDVPELDKRGAEKAMKIMKKIFTIINSREHRRIKDALYGQVKGYYSLEEYTSETNNVAANMAQTALEVLDEFKTNGVGLTLPRYSELVEVPTRGKSMIEKMLEPSKIQSYDVVRKGSEYYVKIENIEYKLPRYGGRNGDRVLILELFTADESRSALYITLGDVNSKGAIMPRKEDKSRSSKFVESPKKTYIVNKDVKEHIEEDTEEDEEVDNDEDNDEENILF